MSIARFSTITAMVVIFGLAFFAGVETYDTAAGQVFIAFSVAVVIMGVLVTMGFASVARPTTVEDLNDIAKFMDADHDARAEAKRLRIASLMELHEHQRRDLRGLREAQLNRPTPVVMRNLRHEEALLTIAIEETVSELERLGVRL
jgi:hypothetical protein